MPSDEFGVGRIVVATGAYCGLDGTDAVRIDEAVPVTALSEGPEDPRVFGVISRIEEPGGPRTFGVGNLRFETANQDPVGPEGTRAQRAVVNSVGEGAIMVCGQGGDIRNGDFIVSSWRAGIGMRQQGVCQTNATVAKATCDCAFFSEGETRLIGCSYRC
jgi:hypothetical protein